MPKRVFVTGIGIISAIGNDVPETIESLKSNKSGIGSIHHLDTVHAGKIPVAEIPLTDQELKDILEISDNEVITRTTLLSYKAVKEAIKSAGLDLASTNRIGFISATTVGGMEKSELYYYDFLGSENNKEFIEVHDCAESTEKVADLLGIKSFITTISTACSSAANAIMLGARLIKHNKLDCVIVGGNECLTKFHINGFNSLMILDKEPCKPFDKDRAGLTLGEGAAYIILESEEFAKKRNAKAICQVSGYGNACDAYHQTASSPEGTGAILAMKGAIESSGLNNSDISYINAHGTGTSNNDLSEGTAIETVFGENVPYVSSTKSFTGHTTSAAGGVEAVISVISLNEGIIPANLNFVNRMDELSFEPVKELITDSNIKHVLTNSFGFGGNNTSLIFSQISD